MFEQLVATPFAMIRRPGLIVLAIILAFIQGAIALLFADYLNVFAINVAGLQVDFSLMFLEGAILFLISTSIPIYMHAWIAQRITQPKTPTPIPMGILGSSLALGVLLALIGMVVLGIGLFISGVITSTDGFLSLVGTIIFLILGLLVFFAIIKFMFTPTFLGRGLPIKEAFAESWKLTTGKFFQALLIVIIFLIVGIVLGSIPGILPIDTTNDWISLLVSGIFAGITGSFSAVALALIVSQDKDVSPYTGMRHTHKTKG